MQKSPEDGHVHPVYYMSRKTTPAQREYPSYKLEVLTVVEAASKFRVYLLGTFFKIYTDCDSLNKTVQMKDLNKKKISR